MYTDSEQYKGLNPNFLFAETIKGNCILCKIPSLNSDVHVFQKALFAINKIMFSFIFSRKTLAHLL
jgi:hypothetical protein